MAKTLGYMVTWTTYGTWLQGEKKGYVKKGKILRGNLNLLKANKSKQAGKKVILNKKQRKIVREAREKEAEKLGQIIYSIAVCSNHVHIAVGYNGRQIEDLVRRYKNAAYFALRKNRVVGRVWTRGYDKRFCFDEKSLKDRIDYVRRHD